MKEALEVVHVIIKTQKGCGRGSCYQPAAFPGSPVSNLSRALVIERRRPSTRTRSKNDQNSDRGRKL